MNFGSSHMYILRANITSIISFAVHVKNTMHYIELVVFHTKNVNISYKSFFLLKNRYIVLIDFEYKVTEFCTLKKLEDTRNFFLYKFYMHFFFCIVHTLYLLSYDNDSIIIINQIGS